MGCCSGYRHGPWCGWGYGYGPPVYEEDLDDVMRRRRGRRMADESDLQRRVDDLEDELERVRSELRAARQSRHDG